MVRLSLGKGIFVEDVFPFVFGLSKTCFYFYSSY